MLFHVISHLPAADLLTVKLVSRRFNDLVNSPHAWIDAFSRYFPGADSLSRTADAPSSGADAVELRSDKRAFTRLGATALWTSEYLLRTKLLRCLERGKPALPFAAPSPGKPNKGFATFTFTSRLKFGISHLQAKFGPVMDKRLPQFIHGLSSHGTVSTSDRRGKFDGWGLLDRISFQDFAELNPGRAQWGAGTGDIVGHPNVMDVSPALGMVYGEGTPGGYVYYLSTGEKNGRYLAPFLNSARHDSSMPRISQDYNSVCCVWIAKSAAVPRMTKGLVGMLSGSSCGVLSSFSAGLSTSDPQQRFERGELTGRWVLSPGVPIIAVMADEQYSEERCAEGRVWAIALNALGEVFYLSGLPQRRSTQVQTDLQPDFLQEVNAWETGSTALWSLVRTSQRSERFCRSEMNPTPSYYLRSVWEGRQTSTDEQKSEMREVELWLSRRPMEIKADFDGWDMRRRLEVDFAGDDGKGAGESVFVFDCGFDDDQPASIRRYTRCADFRMQSVKVAEAPNPKQAQQEPQATQSSIFNPPTWSFVAGGASTATQIRIQPLEPKLGLDSASVKTGEPRRGQLEWRRSRLTYGRIKHFRVSTTAIDLSFHATTTASEDMSLRRAQSGGTSLPSRDSSSTTAADFSPFRVPGQRARFIAAGTSSGTVFIWDARAPPPSSSGLVGTIKPIRVIHTDSPDISAIALSSLYLVHGGSEGLVQAWDVLASTLEPLRTISSRTTLNARRRAVIAAQQNPALQVQMSMSNYAATAICLDPDPTVLRGVVAIGSYLRYWSYSSEAAAEDMSKSQKRKLNRLARGLNTAANDGFAGPRRVALKGYVDREVAQRALEEKEKRVEEKEERRLAGRFGMNLLGDDASEEELIAYATLLSEEDHEKHILQSMEGRLSKDASDAEIEAFMTTLSSEDLERWRYASWQDRLGMPASEHSTVPRGTPAPTPATNTEGDVDMELAEALRLSLEDSQARLPSSPLSLKLSRPQVGSSSRFQRTSERMSPLLQDDDFAEAMRLSLQAEAQTDVTAAIFKSPGMSTKPHSYSEVDDQNEDDIAKAIRLSLQDQGQLDTASQDPSLSRRESGVRLRGQQDEFPALAAPSWARASATSSSLRQKGKVKGKGKGHAVWD